LLLVEANSASTPAEFVAGFGCATASGVSVHAGKVQRRVAARIAQVDVDIRDEPAGFFRHPLREAPPKGRREQGAGAFEGRMIEVPFVAHEKPKVIIRGVLVSHEGVH